MAAHVKLLLASASLLAATPAFATNYTLTASSTGAGDYTFDIGDSAPGKGTFTDTFSFSIPGTSSGSADLGAFNVAASNSTSNIDFISAFLSGPSSLNVPLTVSNTGAISSVYNLASIPVVVGGNYLLSVTYKAGGAGASFNGNVAFTPAPEPAAWAMLVLGFGLIGAGLRYSRRRSQSNVTVRYA